MRRKYDESYLDINGLVGLYLNFVLQAQGFPLGNLLIMFSETESNIYVKGFKPGQKA